MEFGQSDVGQKEMKKDNGENDGRWERHHDEVK